MRFDPFSIPQGVGANLHERGARFPATVGTICNHRTSPPSSRRRNHSGIGDQPSRNHFPDAKKKVFT
jgi:hypothetical protein